MRYSKLLLLMLVLAMPLVGGCNQLAYLGYLIAPAVPAQKIEAEFKDFPNHSVAVVIYADQSTLYEYPYARMELTQLLNDKLKTNVKNITVIDSLRVAKFQNDNLNWDSMGKTDMGKTLKADYVLYISLVEFTTREPSSANLLRGSAKAEISVYKTDLPERKSRVYPTGSSVDVSAVFPTEGPVGEIGPNDAIIRRTTMDMLTARIVEKFYKHDAPKDKDDGKNDKNDK